MTVFKYFLPGILFLSFSLQASPLFKFTIIGTEINFQLNSGKPHFYEKCSIGFSILDLEIEYWDHHSIEYFINSLIGSKLININFSSDGIRTSFFPLKVVAGLTPYPCYISELRFPFVYLFETVEADWLNIQFYEGIKYSPYLRLKSAVVLPFSEITYSYLFLPLSKQLKSKHYVGVELNFLGYFRPPAG